jgi:DNA-binding NtrC family response regulator
VFARQYNKPVQKVEPKAMQILIDYNWPGNVRELKNSVARAMILSKSTSITVEDLPSKILAESGLAEQKAGTLLIQGLPGSGVTLRQMETELIQKTLEKHQGNKSLAAQSLGISRKTLYEKIDRYGLTHTEREI